MSEYNFKKFEGQHARVEERITITKSSSIGFPTGFYNKNNLKDYRFAILYWDEGAKAIGIQLTNDESEKSKFSIVKSKANYGGGIVARSFFRSNGIEPEKYHGRYDWQKINTNGVEDLFVIKLKEYSQD